MGSPSFPCTWEMRGLDWQVRTTPPRRAHQPDRRHLVPFPVMIPARTSVIPRLALCAVAAALPILHGCEGSSSEAERLRRAYECWEGALDDWCDAEVVIDPAESDPEALLETSAGLMEGVTPRHALWMLVRFGLSEDDERALEALDLQVAKGELLVEVVTPRFESAMDDLDLWLAALDPAGAAPVPAGHLDALAQILEPWFEASDDAPLFLKCSRYSSMSALPSGMSTPREEAAVRLAPGEPILTFRPATSAGEDFVVERLGPLLDDALERAQRLSNESRARTLALEEAAEVMEAELMVALARSGAGAPPSPRDSKASTRGELEALREALLLSSGLGDWDTFMTRAARAKIEGLEAALDEVNRWLAREARRVPVPVRTVGRHEADNRYSYESDGCDELSSVACSVLRSIGSRSISVEDAARELRPALAAARASIETKELPDLATQRHELRARQLRWRLAEAKTKLDELQRTARMEGDKLQELRTRYRDEASAHARRRIELLAGISVGR